MKKIQKSLLLLAFILIFIVFFKVYLDVLHFFFVAVTPGDAIKEGILLVLFMLFLLGIYVLLKKQKPFLEKNNLKILLVFLVFLLFAQMMIGNRLRITPVFDFSAVYDGAVEWINTGSFKSFYEYYYRYPNNLGALFFLHFFFKIVSLVGVKDFYFVGMLINSLLSLVLVACTFEICKKLFTSTEAVFSLVIYGLCPPMYFMAPVFYTDQLTMAFPVVILFLWIIFEEKEFEWKKSGLLAAFIAIIGFIGYFLKPTAFIIFIAIFIAMILKGEWKKLLLLFGNVAIFFVILTVSVNGYFYSCHLDKEIAQKKNTPIEVWIYMGLNENLGFSLEDTELALAIEDPQLRKTTVREKIGERIKNYGVNGMYQHLKNKEITLGDGTFALSESFIFGFNQESKWGTNTLTLLGEDYGMYWNICTLPWYTLILLGVICEGILSLKLFRNRLQKEFQDSADENSKDLYFSIFPIALSLFGLYLFLMIWEIHCRYWINHYGFFVIMAVAGMYYAKEAGMPLIKRKCLEKGGKRECL